MKSTKLLTLLLSLIIIPQLTFAQCDPDLFERLHKTLPEYELLKRYPVTVKEMEGLPFSVEYTYVLTRGRSYAFYLEHSANSKGVVDLRLSDPNGVLRNDKMESIKQGSGELLKFNCLKTGIYYINLHSDKSFNGCAVLQLSHLRSKSIQPCDLELYERLDDITSDEFTILKEYWITSEKKMEYSYVFTKGNSYRVYVERSDASKQGINFSLLNNNKKLVNNIRHEQTSTGLIFTIDCKITGIYYLNLEIDGANSCAVVQLANKATGSNSQATRSNPQ